MVKVPATAGRRLFRFLVSLLITGTLGLGSCGIDDYPYLDPVPSGIPLLLNTTAFIRLPDHSGNQYFQYYIIYYRIYISGLSIPGNVSTDQMYQINSTLASDYNALLSYTNTDSTTSTVPTNMGTVFSNRRYYTLTLEGDSIENVLKTGNMTITLDFARSSPLRPALFLGDTRENPASTAINLWRYSESGYMYPHADYRYFVNSDEINNGSYINSVTYTNLDVQNNTVSGPKYTYVSMYILAYGVDGNFSNIYSTPTFIGVFRLPD